MTGAGVESTVLTTVQAALTSVPRMAPVLNVEDLSKGKGRRFWIPTQKRAIRVAEQWDVAADAFVLDCELGSLGLIQIVPTQPSTEAWVRDRVSEAVHLRHLL